MSSQFSAALRRSVLVLDRSWAPVGFVSTRKALALLFTSCPDQKLPRASWVRLEDLSLHDLSSSWAVRPAAECAHDPTLEIRTPQLAVRAPTAIVLARSAASLALNRPPKRYRFSRLAVLCRDMHTCAYCGKRAATVDHVYPRVLGGKSNFENVVACCEACNRSKGERTLDECKMRIRPGVKRKPPCSREVAGQRRAMWEKYWHKLMAAATE
jgi:HNH endonuclease